MTTGGTNFTRGANPVWSYVDLAGKQFDDTFYMWTLTNEIPYIPQAVYHDVSGLIPWTDPIQFLANGTLPIDIFFDDTKVYRLEFRQHVGLGPPTQADPLIYIVENYIPNGTGFIPSDVEGAVTENQISNAQFSAVNFLNPLTVTGLSSPTSIPIAPGWFLDLDGPGTATIDLVAMNSSIPSPTNAPYSLHLTLSGPWNVQPILRQRFQQNGQNWQGKYVSTSITGLIQGAGQPININLTASNGAPIALLLSVMLTNTFAEYNGNTLIPTFVNPNTPPNAWIDYKILLPASAELNLTSIQLVVGTVASNYEYQQDTIDRQQDHLSHYFLPLVAEKPIPSYLTGWDFTLNPAQFGSSGGPFSTGATTSNYIWDQTILFQTLTNGFTFQRLFDGALQINANVNSSQGAIVQYLSGAEVINLLENPLCAFMKIGSSVPIPVTVSLWYTAGSALPSMTSNNSIVATLNATGGVATTNLPTAGTWIQIPNNNLGPQQVMTSGLANAYDEFSLSYWQVTSTIISNATYFAIVIGFGALPTNTDYISFNSVSLQAGFVPTRPAPESYQQVLTDCEQYYEMSYNNRSITNLIGTAVSTGQVIVPMATYIDTSGMGTTYINNGPFSFQYRTYKNIDVPVITLYSPAVGTANLIDAKMQNYRGNGGSGTATTVKQFNPATYWNFLIGNKSCSFTPKIDIPSSGSFDLGSSTGGTANLYFQYTIDARLGYP